MRCFFCGSTQSSVIDKRMVATSGEIRRRRECLKCGSRYTTYERASGIELYVLKRDGNREVFDRNKLQLGIEKALEKRPAQSLLNSIVDQVVNKIKVKRKKEIQSKIIGQTVLSELKKVDKVAYLRFASVYRQFNDPTDFKKELEHLKL